MPWLILGLLAAAFVLPYAAYGLSVLRVEAEKKRMLPQWRALARAQDGVLVERGRTLEIELALGRVVATRHDRLRNVGGVRWARWETVVSVPAPATWPEAVEIYGRRAISEIVTTRRRIPIEPDFDRVVLVRDRDGDGAGRALERLAEPTLRDGLAQTLAAAPEVCIADGQIHSRLSGLPSPPLLESRILCARQLRRHLDQP